MAVAGHSNYMYPGSKQRGAGPNRLRGLQVHIGKDMCQLPSTIGDRMGWRVGGGARVANERVGLGLQNSLCSEWPWSYFSNWSDKLQTKSEVPCKIRLRQEQKQPGYAVEKARREMRPKTRVPTTRPANSVIAKEKLMGLSKGWAWRLT